MCKLLSLDRLAIACSIALAWFACHTVWAIF